MLGGPGGAGRGGTQRLPRQLLELDFDKLVVVAVGSRCHAVRAGGHYRYPWIIVSMDTALSAQA